MTAVLLPDLAPGSADWLKRMTASKVAAVLGLSPWESRYSLYMRMAGLIDPQPQTDEMTRGHYLEPAVAAWFADQHPEFLVRPGQGWAHPVRDWQAASPDRLLVSRPAFLDGDPGPHALLEIKSESFAYADEWKTEPPPYVRCQVTWQLDVLGVPTAYVAAILPGLEFREYRIDYNADEAAYLRAEAAQFMETLPGGLFEQRPDLDGHVETYAAVRSLHPQIDPRDQEIPVDLAREFCDATRGLKAAKEREALARVRLADHMGNARTAVFIDGDTRIKLADRRAKNGGTPYVQAASKLPEIGSAA